MNLELAQKLKDAGFPQGTPNERLQAIIQKGGTINFDNNSPLIPTLTDLAQDCKGFIAVIRIPGALGWTAIAEGYPAGVIKGESEDAALAYLWIEQHKNIGQKINELYDAIPEQGGTI